MDISKWGFQNRNLVYFLVAVLLAGGALACYQMSKLEDPEIKVKLAMVATTYPGASAHQVELEVTDVLEKSIRKMDNVDNVESYSFNDLSLIQVELLTTVKDDDVEQHWDLLRRKVNDASALLPSGANTPIVQDDFGKVFGMFYALTGDGLSDREMADYAEPDQTGSSRNRRSGPGGYIWGTFRMYQYLPVAGPHGQPRRETGRSPGYLERTKRDNL